jgi:hypothetical protein
MLMGMLSVISLSAVVAAGQPAWIHAARENEAVQAPRGKQPDLLK